MIRHTYEKLEGIIEELDHLSDALEDNAPVQALINAVSDNIEETSIWLINLETYLQKNKPELLDELYAISDTFKKKP